VARFHSRVEDRRRRHSIFRKRCDVWSRQRALPGHTRDRSLAPSSLQQPTPSCQSGRQYGSGSKELSPRRRIFPAHDKRFLYEESFERYSLPAPPNHPSYNHSPLSAWTPFSDSPPGVISFSHPHPRMPPCRSF
jgi:hypothetical protein